MGSAQSLAKLCHMRDSCGTGVGTIVRRTRLFEAPASLDTTMKLAFWLLSGRKASCISRRAFLSVDTATRCSKARSKEHSTTAMRPPENSRVAPHWCRPQFTKC